MLGDLLKDAREQQNLTLDDVENETNIRKLYLRSIENGEYDKLPGEVFLKGFIKSYGKFLKLDEQALLEQYYAEKHIKHEQPVAKADKQEPPTKKTEVATSEHKQAPKQPARKSAPNAKLSNLSYNQAYLMNKPSHHKRNLIISLIVVIIILVVAIYAFTGNSSTDNKSVAPAKATTQTTATVAPNKVYTDAELSATFDKDSWIEVKVDGKTVLSETVKAGSKLSWKGTKQISITVGNAGAVNLTFNGKEVPKLGDLGAVVSKDFKAPDSAFTESKTK